MKYRYAIQYWCRSSGKYNKPYLFDYDSMSIYKLDEEGHYSRYCFDSRKWEEMSTEDKFNWIKEGEDDICWNEEISEVEVFKLLL